MGANGGEVDAAMIAAQSPEQRRREVEALLELPDGPTSRKAFREWLGVNGGVAAVHPSVAQPSTEPASAADCAACACGNEEWPDPFCACDCHDRGFSPEHGGTPREQMFRDAAFEALRMVDADVTDDRVVHLAGLLENLADGYTEEGDDTPGVEVDSGGGAVGPQEEYQPITLEAHGMVFGDRQADYGHPIDDFDTTAEYWTTYLHSRRLLAQGKCVIGEDVAPMMQHVKLSRYANGINTGKPKRDTNTDVAGYAEAGWRVIHERAARGLGRAYGRNAHLRQIMDTEAVAANNAAWDKVYAALKAKGSTGSTPAGAAPGGESLHTGMAHYVKPNGGVSSILVTCSRCGEPYDPMFATTSAGCRGEKG